MAFRDPTAPSPLLDALPDGFVHLDRAWRYTYVNPAAARLLGQPPEALLGRVVWDAFPRSPFEPALRRAMAEGAPAAVEGRAGADERWYECRLYPSAEGLSVLFCDVTARKAEEGARRERDARQFSALADAAPQVVWLLAPDGTVRFLNQQGRAFFGLEPDEVPLGWASRIHPDDRPRMAARWRRALEAGTVFEDEVRLLRHDGAFTWHLVRALPVRDEAGAITDWCGISTDIDALKRAQQALQEREQLFRTMADAAPVLIWVADTTKGCTYFNRSWLAFTGRPADAERGFGWVEGVHPDDRDRCLQRYTDAFEARQPFTCEYRLRRHDGAYRWLLDHGTPLLADDGAFAGYIGSCVDIHERRQAEEQRALLAAASPLLTSSPAYETTLQAVADLMVPHLADWCAVDLVNAEGGVDLVAVAHVDPEKVKWGYELRRHNPVDLRAPTGLPHVIRTGQSEFYPFIPEELIEATAKTDEEREVIRQIGFRSVIVVPLHARGQTLGGLTLVWSDSDRHYTEADLQFAEELARRCATVVDNARLYREAQAARDALQGLNETLEARVVERTEALLALNRQLHEEVEERRRTQQALARVNTQLEQRNRELQDFAYVASHDLQEPLRKIRSFAEILKEEHGAQMGEGRAYLTRIEEASERLIQLIRDLLAFSRVATRGQAFESIDLSAVVAEVLSDLEVSLSESGGRVEAGALCAVEADPTQMRQLFQNLIGNALKFRRKGVPPVVRLHAARAGAACRIEVEDNGIGFEEKYLDRIFSPFQRLHSRGEYPGTGMGLAICRRIVERHGGTLTARSTPGAGTTFVVTLPVEHPHPEAA